MSFCLAITETSEDGYAWAVSSEYMYLRFMLFNGTAILVSLVRPSRMAGLASELTGGGESTFVVTFHGAVTASIACKWYG